MPPAVCATHRVRPAPPTSPSPASLPSRKPPFSWTTRVSVRIQCLYNWIIWGLVTTLLFAQFFGVIWSSVTSSDHIYFGQSPALGKYAIPGFNDEPYADRAVACVKRGLNIRPIQLSQLLQQEQRSTNASTTTTTAINGYRVVSRDSFTMDASSFAFYVRQCSALSFALDSILASCESLGYNVTRDFLRVVDGVESDDLVALPATLPVLIVPFWDYGALSRFIVPGRDGSACVFRGGGVLESDSETTSVAMRVVPRATREAATARLLQSSGGVWRNGWFEDSLTHVRWYSDVVSSVPDGEYDAGFHQFVFSGDTVRQEGDCSKPPYGCSRGTSTWTWSADLSQLVDMPWFHSIAISNGSRYGLFLFDALRVQRTTSRYSLEKLLSNACFVVVLARWLAAMVALSPVDSIGIGALANAKSFHLLPYFLMPRLQSTLVGFWTAGCNFEGDQRVLGDAWFEIYPAIGELVFLLFSLLNLLAKALRRRMSDALFGPTLLFFGLLHYFRFELASQNWFEFDKRLSTVIMAHELEAASAIDWFTTDLALRTNGNATSLFTIKLVVLALNLMPLLLASRSASDRTSEDGDPLELEQALAFSFAGNAGLGSTAHPYTRHTASCSDTVRPYELVRAGWLVVGSQSESPLLMTVYHWFVVLATSPFRRVTTLTARVVVYEIHSVADANGISSIAASPQIIAVAEEQLACLTPWQISTRVFR